MVELTDEEIEELRLSMLDGIGWWPYLIAKHEEEIFNIQKINEEQSKSKIKVIKK